jgi:hypothetical protein
MKGDTISEEESDDSACCDYCCVGGVYRFPDNKKGQKGDASGTKRGTKRDKKGTLLFIP